MKKQNIYKNGFNLFDTCWDIYPKVLKKISFKKNEIVLDAGCGSGNLGKYLDIKNLYGIDLSKEAIEKIDKTRYKKIFVASLEKMPFPNNFFDTIISIQVIQYPEDPEKIFKELVRVTKNKIVITSANFNWFKLKSIIYPPYRKKYLELISKERYISNTVFKKLAKEYDLELKIFYLSNKYGWFRNLFGNLLSSEVVGIFYLK